MAYNNASFTKVSTDISLASTDSASKTVGVIQEQFNGIALSQIIDEIETRLNDAQTMIDELKLYDIRQDFTMSALETWADRHHYIITELQELDSGDHQGEDYTWSVALSCARGSGKTIYTDMNPSFQPPIDNEF